MTDPFAFPEGADLFKIFDESLAAAKALGDFPIVAEKPRVHIQRCRCGNHSFALSHEAAICPQCLKKNNLLKCLQCPNVVCLPCRLLQIPPTIAGRWCVICRVFAANGDLQAHWKTPTHFQALLHCCDTRIFCNRQCVSNKTWIVRDRAIVQANTPIFVCHSCGGIDIVAKKK